MERHRCSSELHTDRNLQTRAAVFLHRCLLSSYARRGMAVGHQAQVVRRSLLLVVLSPQVMCFAPGLSTFLIPIIAA